MKNSKRNYERYKKFLKMQIISFLIVLSKIQELYNEPNREFNKDKLLSFDFSV